MEAGHLVHCSDWSLVGQSLERDIGPIGQLWMGCTTQYCGAFCIMLWSVIMHHLTNIWRGGRGISAIDLVNYIIFIYIGLGYLSEQEVSLAYYVSIYLPIYYSFASIYIGLMLQVHELKMQLSGIYTWCALMMPQYVSAIDHIAFPCLWSAQLTRCLILWSQSE